MSKPEVTHTEKVIVNNKNDVPVDCTEIFDIWHIAMRLTARDQEKVLEVWTQAHAMLDHIKRERGVE